MKKDEIIMSFVFAVIGIAFGIIALAVKSTVAKWIWGILAILVICFTIYGTIDAIIKNKQNKDVLEFLSGGGDDLDMQDFAQSMQAAAHKRDLLYDGQHTDSPDYGYSSSNPIMTSTISSSKQYLSKLRTIDGEPLTWERSGSMCMKEIHGVREVMVDEYQLYLYGEKYKTIYISPYGHNGTFVPQGLKLSEE